MRVVRIAARRSKLAVAQAEIVGNWLCKLSCGLEISVVGISTKGDRDRQKFLYKAESKGFFTSEVEQAVIDGRADLAVHSLKDLPTAPTEGLSIAAIPRRESVADALVARGGVASIDDLPTGAAVGTSSLRRIAQLRHIRNDLNCVPLRGNVESRISKVQSGQLDAVIVACAGLNRLGLGGRISAVLEPARFLTAPGQGALAVQVRSSDTELNKLVSRLDDEQVRIAVQAERHILAAMHGGCSIPLGVYCRLDGGDIVIDAVIADTDGRQYVRRSKSASIEQALSCAEELAGQLLSAGGRGILDRVRRSRDS